VSGFFPLNLEDISMASKVFTVESSKHGKLADLYLLLPSMTEVFHNVVQDRPLHCSVLSNLSAQSFAGILAEYIIPVFLENALIVRDERKACGYSTEFTDIVFADLGVRDMLSVTKERCAQIAESSYEGDTRENLLTANIYFAALPPHARAEMFQEIRSVLQKYMDLPGGHDVEGTSFRLSLVARGELKEMK
jgi:hypothetical protein